MKYYNQYDYFEYPYPAQGYENATIATSGCGPACISMIVETIATEKFPPELSAQYAIDIGARVSGGTDMNVLGNKIAQKINLKFSVTSDINKLLAHLKKGGLAIANVGGDKGGYTGVFSSGGHYIVVGGINSEGKLIVFDPGYYIGKFNKSGRYNKVSESNFPEIYVETNVLNKDCETRYPKYYLFSKEGEDEDMALIKEIMHRTEKSEEDVVQALSVLVQFANVKEEAWEKQGVEKLKDMGLINSEHDGREPLSFGAFGTMMDRLKNMITKI